MIIRQEKPSDYDEVCELVKRSFATNEDDDGTTHDYLNELRNKDCFIPELSLVAEHENGEIVGQIVLYKADIVTKDETITELVLSPICVLPDYFNRGIARKMAEKSFEIAKELGYKAIFLCGEPKIYSRLGFTPTYKRAAFIIFGTKRKTPIGVWCVNWLTVRWTGLAGQLILCEKAENSL